jgi:uncharacterized protein (DUF1330 family)
LKASPTSTESKSTDGTTTLEEILVDRAGYAGRRVRASGEYRQCLTSLGIFVIEQGDQQAYIRYTGLPADQKAMVLRESQAKGRAVVVEGTVEAGDGSLYIRADSVAVEGLTPSPPRSSGGGTTTLEEILVDRAGYAGRRVRVSGEYRQCLTSLGIFVIEQGDQQAYIRYTGLPADQKAMVLRESQAKGRAVGVEGTVEAGDGSLYIRADSVTIM